MQTVTWGRKQLWLREKKNAEGRKCLSLQSYLESREEHEKQKHRSASGQSRLIEGNNQWSEKAMCKTKPHAHWVADL